MGDATPDPRAWLALCAALALVSILVWMLGLATPLAWQPAAWPARPWLFWTGSLAHASGSLLSASLAALAVLAIAQSSWFLAVWALTPMTILPVMQALLSRKGSART